MSQSLSLIHICNGPRRTLPLAARYADEWNAVYISPARFAELNGMLDGLLAAVGREPASLRRSLMIGCLFGRDAAEVERKLAARHRTAAEMVERGVAAGTGEEIAAQLAAWAAAGVQRVMLQWLDLDDLDGLEALAGKIIRN